MELKQAENSSESTENPRAAEIKRLEGLLAEKQKILGVKLKTSSGRKDDQGKLPYELLPFSVIDDIVKVQSFGAAKYGPNNWQRVKRGKARYIAAALRHISAVQQGQRYDQESGLPHLAHALCSLIYAQWIDEQHLKRHGRYVQP